MKAVQILAEIEDTRRCTGSAVMSRPSNTMVPTVGRKKPLIKLNKVVLPAPLGPMIARSSPLGTAVVRQNEDARLPADIGHCIVLEVEIEAGVKNRTHGKFVHQLRPLLASRCRHSPGVGSDKIHWEIPTA